MVVSLLKLFLNYYDPQGHSTKILQEVAFTERYTHQSKTMINSNTHEWESCRPVTPIFTLHTKTLVRSRVGLSTPFLQRKIYSNLMFLIFNYLGVYGSITKGLHCHAFVFLFDPKYTSKKISQCLGSKPAKL